MTDRTKSTTPGHAAPEDPARGWPGAALDAAIHAARHASPLVTGPDGQIHALVPPGYGLKPLPDDYRLPPRAAGRLTVDDRASLSAYANHFKDLRSIIIADYDAMAVTAHLDWHPHNGMDGHAEPGPDAHSVTLKLRPSEEFSRWDAMEGKLHAQDEFARFLEENSADVGYPEAATMVEISRDFEATSGQSYKSSVRLDNGDRRLTYESESRARNDIVVPEKFVLSIPIWNGEDPSDLTCLFRWRGTGSGEVRFGFQWHRVEYLRRAHFTAIATAAAEETGLPVFIGRKA